MLSFESVVWALFRSIDLFVLIALAVWLFIRKGLPAIRKKIAAEREKEVSLAQAVEDLRLHAEQLDQQLIDDTHDIERLEQKVRLWQQAIKRKLNREITEKEDILIRLHKQDELRAHTVRHQKFYATALLEAVDAAEHVLEQDATGGAATVDKLMQFMASHKESA